MIKIIITTNLLTIKTITTINNIINRQIKQLTKIIITIKNLQKKRKRLTDTVNI